MHSCAKTFDLRSTYLGKGEVNNKNKNIVVNSVVSRAVTYDNSDLLKIRFTNIVYNIHGVTNLTLKASIQKVTHTSSGAALHKVT